MSAPDISHERCEQVAQHLRDRLFGQSAQLVRALRAALDAAERERDEARKERAHQQGRADANARKTAEEQRRADAADATGYARGLKWAAMIAETNRAHAEHHMRRAKEDCHASEEQHQSGRWHASNDIEKEILALLPATTETKETRDE